MVSAPHYALFWTIAVSGAGLDLLTKWLAFTLVGPPSSKLVVWPEVFSLTTSFNRGALWGFGSHQPYANHLFAVLSVLAALAFLYWLYWRGAAHDRTISCSLGLLMAGTAGNCYDRIVWGKVRDFLYFELINWPIFNLADSCLVCGALILVWQAFFAEMPPPRTIPAPSAESSNS
jgi:signal peptidase II